MIDAESFSPALRAGAFDACLDYLRREDGGGPDDAPLNCRAAEALFHCGRRDDAVECGRRAFAAAPGDRDTARFCAWLFSNCDCHSEAVAAYERLIAQSPDWAEGYRHASGSLAAIGEIDRAIALALHAVELMPDDNDTAVHAAELLLHRGRVEDAAGLLRTAVWRDPGDARMLRVLSAVEMMLDRLDAALIGIDHALAITPGIAEYHLHRGHLLHRLGDIAAAGEAFDRAASLEPDSRP